jgi:hypothetical protein
MARPFATMIPVLTVALFFAAVTGSARSEDMTQIAELKEAYLSCERRAMENDLDTVEIMRCSVIYEDLKERAFSGDFRKLKAWSDTLLHGPGSRLRIEADQQVARTQLLLIGQ